MKCEYCQFLCYPEYESNYTVCGVFGEGLPSKYERKDGEGCIFNRMQLEKIHRKNEEARMKEMEAFVKWYEENELKGGAE